MIGIFMNNHGDWSRNDNMAIVGKNPIVEMDELISENENTL